MLFRSNAAAATSFKAALANNPADPVTNYRLGLAYLGMTPPQSIDGFWSLARAINLKIPDADKIKDYLHKAIYNYEQPGCETSVDEQVNELLTLAGTSGDRPATYTIPAAADLQKIAQASTILTVITDMSAGGPSPSCEFTGTASIPTIWTVCGTPSKRTCRSSGASELQLQMRQNCFWPGCMVITAGV